MLSPSEKPQSRSANFSAALDRNIEAMTARRKTDAKARSASERFADLITGFVGSMVFVYLHIIVYGTWIAINLGLITFVHPFDKSFVILATEASVEAIFLSTFVLISQNKMASAADKRADLDLQINLLAEHELTKVAEMLVTIMDHLGIAVREDGEIIEVTKDIKPEVVLDELERKSL